MKVKVRKMPARRAKWAKYETIRSYIAKHFEEYKKTHPLELEKGCTDPHEAIEAEKKRYATFIWEFMNSIVNQG